jgi:uncharacterized OsmC-like protein
MPRILLDGAPAHLELPLDGVVRATALFAHDLQAAGGRALAIARAIASRGVATLITDAVGLDATLPRRLAAATAHLERELGRAPALGIGHGAAAAALLRETAQSRATRAIALVHPHLDPAHLDPLDTCAVLVLGGSDDTREASLAAWPATTSVVTIDGADYALSRADDATWAGEVIAAWAGRYLAPAADALVSADPVEEGRHIVARTRAEGYRTEIMAGGHAFVVDEPVKVGGTDTGPTPYDLLASALGACTAMTLHMYAKRKGWPLEEAIVRLRHGKVHADDEITCAHRPARLDAIERSVELVGALDDEQRARLMEIADRCPVHRTLDAGVRIHARAPD